jgi:hypothetical protein
MGVVRDKGVASDGVGRFIVAMQALPIKFV